VKIACFSLVRQTTLLLLLGCLAGAGCSKEDLSDLGKATGLSGGEDDDEKKDPKLVKKRRSNTVAPETLALLDSLTGRDMDRELKLIVVAPEDPEESKFRKFKFTRAYLFRQGRSWVNRDEGNIEMAEVHFTASALITAPYDTEQQAQEAEPTVTQEFKYYLKFAYFPDLDGWYAVAGDPGQWAYATVTTNRKPIFPGSAHRELVERVFSEQFGSAEAEVETESDSKSGAETAEEPQV